MQERLFIVTYDIGQQKRWRAVFNLLKGYGEWVQLSVFQCRLNPVRHAELLATLDQIIHHQEDHVLLMDMGSAETVKPKVVSLGKANFRPIERNAMIV
jgi:CRISPR-associated protein Cas2